MNRHETPVSRLSVMENASEATLIHNAEKSDKLAQINERINSPEVEVLNNQAELLIFGDGGDNDQTDYEVKSLNDAGGVVVEYKFKDDEPLRGLENIRSNPRYGKTSTERDQAAGKYIREYTRLLKKEHLQPTQAKLLMDMKMSDAIKAAELVDERVRSREKRNEAVKAVKVRYEKKFDAQLKLVRDEGIMTLDEYNAKRTESKLTTPEPVTQVEKQEAEKAEEKSLIPPPPTVKEALGRTTIKQAIALNDAWDKQTRKDVVEIKVDASEVNDVPPIIVNDDEIIVDGDDANNERLLLAAVATPEKKRNWKKSIAIGAVALASLVGLGFFAESKLDDKDGTKLTPATAETPDSVPDSGIDFSDAIEGIDDAEVPSTTTPEETTPENTEAPVAPEAVAPTSDTADVTQENMNQLESSIAERTAVISDAQAPEGKPDVPYSIAVSLYGKQATNRIIQAVDALKAEGVDAQWHGDPMTDRTAWISIDGNSETIYVWNRLAQEMAKQDVANYLNQTVEDEE